MSAIRADWRSATSLPCDLPAILKMPKGDVTKGVRAPDRGDGLVRAYVMDRTGRRREIVPSGWLPALGTVSALPSQAHLTIGESMARVETALRTLRAIRVERGPREFPSAWPATLKEWADKRGHWQDGVYYSIDEDGQRIKIDNESPWREIFVPTQRDLDDDRLLAPLRWFTRLSADERAGSRQLSLPQAIVWDRSLALVNGPPSWRWIAKWHGSSDVAVQRVWEDARRRLWLIANGGGGA
jgi:hypothetical protein